MYQSQKLASFRERLSEETRFFCGGKSSESAVLYPIGYLEIETAFLRWKASSLLPRFLCHSEPDTFCPLCMSSSISLSLLCTEDGSDKHPSSTIRCNNSCEFNYSRCTLNFDESGFFKVFMATRKYRAISSQILICDNFFRSIYVN